MPDPDHALYGRELKVVLESLIDRLPDSCRVVFVMREVEGLSTADTAACLEVNEETVKTRLHRAKRLLKDQLDRQLGPVSSGVYAFHLSRCDRVVAGVMPAIARLSARGGHQLRRSKMLAPRCRRSRMRRTFSRRSSTRRPTPSSSRISTAATCSSTRRRPAS
ncbi:MAG: sigma factor-like helix-turn-helix DNA-binding protein [Vicinamibacterales bacterium]